MASAPSAWASSSVSICCLRPQSSGRRAARDTAQPPLYFGCRPGPRGPRERDRPACFADTSPARLRLRRGRAALLLTFTERQTGCVTPPQASSSVSGSPGLGPHRDCSVLTVWPDPARAASPAFLSGLRPPGLCSPQFPFPDSETPRPCLAALTRLTAGVVFTKTCAWEGTSRLCSHCTRREPRSYHVFSIRYLLSEWL